MRVLTNFFRERYERSRQPAWAFASQIATSGGNFLTTVILIRAIGLTDFGRFTLAFMAIIVARNLMLAAVLTPMAAIAPKLQSRSAPHYRAFVATTALAYIASASLVLLGAALLAGLLTGQQWVLDAAPAIALASFASNFSDFFQRYLFVSRRAEAAAFNNLVRYGLQVSGLLVLAGWFGQYLSVSVALLVLAGAGMVTALLGWLKFGHTAWRSDFSRAVWSKHWNMARWLTPSQVLLSIQNAGLVLIASIFFTDALIGALRAMLNVSNMLLLPMNALENVAASTAARKYSNSGLGALLALQKRLAIVMGSMALLLTVAAWMFQEQVVLLVIGEFQPVYGHLLVLYCLASVASTLQFAFTVGLQGMERAQTILTNSVLTTVLSFGSFFALIVPLGILAVPGARIVAMSYSSFSLWKAISDMRGTRPGPSQSRQAGP